MSLKKSDLDLLMESLNKYSIDVNNICIVGSTILSINNIRENKDLDITINPHFRRKFLKENKNIKVLNSGTFDITNYIQSVKGRYEKIGISDFDLFSDNEHFFTDEFDGIKAVKLEVEIAQKIKRNRPKDRKDLLLFFANFDQYTSFDWKLFQSCQRKNIKKNKFKKFYYYLFNISRCINKYHQLINRRKKEKGSFKLNSSLKAQSVSVVSPIGILGKQYNNGVFCRYDIIVRYISADFYKSMKNYNFELYRKMQNKRSQIINIEEFTLLYESFKNNGFLRNYPIPIDCNGNLINGSHRMALSLFFDCPEVRILEEAKNFFADFTLEWFKKSNFTISEINLIKEYKRKLFVEKGVYFCAILWGSVEKSFDIIEEDISKLYNICYVRDINFGKEDFNIFVKDIYSIDDIDDWKVEFKLNLLSKYKNIVRFVMFEIPDPTYRIKERNSSFLCNEGALLKSKIRNSYKNSVHNYYNDVIIHTGDNYIDNKKILEIVSSYCNIDITKVKVFD